MLGPCLGFKPAKLWATEVERVNSTTWPQDGPKNFKLYNSEINVGLQLFCACAQMYEDVNTISLRGN